MTPIQPIQALQALQPLQSLQSLSGTDKSTQVSGSGSSLPFQDLFQDAINNVKSTNDDMNQEIYKLATGQSDDLHNLTIASEKATLSVQLLVQLRNKALDAYNEIMRMNV